MKSLSANTWEELFIQRTMDMTAMVAGHLQIKKGKYYMVLELKSESGERKTK